MNNHRIEEIADQCWKDTFHYGPNGPETYTEFDYEKFAELIVRECAEISKKYAGGSMPLSIALAIKDHFGVKE